MSEVPLKAEVLGQTMNTRGASLIRNTGGGADSDERGTPVGGGARAARASWEGHPPQRRGAS